jgi:hypothetical protein
VTCGGVLGIGGEGSKLDARAALSEVLHERRNDRLVPEVSVADVTQDRDLPNRPNVVSLERVHAGRGTGRSV